jgi:hypothetical protein
MIRDVNVSASTPEGPTSMKISPEDMQGDIDLTISEDSMQPLSQQDKITQVQSFVEQLTATQNQSIEQNKALGTQPLAVDWTIISEYLAQQYNLKGFTKILIPQKEVQELQQKQLAQATQHMANAQQQAGQTPPTPMTNPVQTPGGHPIETADLVKLYSEVSTGVQDEILLTLGLKPDGQPSQSAQKNLISAVGAVTKTAQAGHGINMDNLQQAHAVVKHAVDTKGKQIDQAIQIAQAQQPPTPVAPPGTPQEPAPPQQ